MTINDNTINLGSFVNTQSIRDRLVRGDMDLRSAYRFLYELCTDVDYLRAMGRSTQEVAANRAERLHAAETRLADTERLALGMYYIAAEVIPDQDEEEVDDALPEGWRESIRAIRDRHERTATNHNDTKDNSTP